MLAFSAVRDRRLHGPRADQKADLQLRSLASRSSSTSTQSLSSLTSSSPANTPSSPNRTNCSLCGQGSPTGRPKLSLRRRPSPRLAADFIQKAGCEFPEKRLTVEQALRHSFVTRKVCLQSLVVNVCEAKLSLIDPQQARDSWQRADLCPVPANSVEGDGTLLAADSLDVDGVAALDPRQGLRAALKLLMYSRLTQAQVFLPQTPNPPDSSQNQKKEISQTDGQDFFLLGQQDAKDSSLESTAADSHSREIADHHIGGPDGSISHPQPPPSSTSSTRTEKALRLKASTGRKARPSIVPVTGTTSSPRTLARRQRKTRVTRSSSRGVRTASDAPTHQSTSNT